MQFKKAVKSKCKARVAIYGPSGSGKTFSALRIAQGMGKKVAVIDSERHSASKYADRFEFDALDLEKADIANYVAAIQTAKDYDVLIIDSLSHGWQELLQEVDKLANAKYRGNTWSAWSEGTPKQRKLIDAILSFPGHVIATMRSKTEWTQEATSNGKTKPVRVGLAPEQGKGIEYEFDILMALSTDHIANVEKDRSGKFQDAIIDKPGEDFGESLAAWLSEGEPQPGELTEGDTKWLEDFKQQLADANTREVLETIAAFGKDKSPELRKVAGPLWVTRAKTFGWQYPSWKLPDGVESGWLAEKAKGAA